MVNVTALRTQVDCLRLSISLRVAYIERRRRLLIHVPLRRHLLANGVNTCVVYCFFGFFFISGLYMSLIFPQIAIFTQDEVIFLPFFYEGPTFLQYVAAQVPSHQNFISQLKLFQ